MYSAVKVKLYNVSDVIKKGVSRVLAIEYLD